MHNHPSLECVTMFIFAYMPYGLSEGLELSGIMAILLCGITMSHYAHFNLSPIGQLAAQQIFRVLALVAETIVFLFLGLSMLNGVHVIDIRFISWSLVICLIARACVVFPLSLFFIYCRSKENRISMKILFLVWFSGLRGSVAYAQSLHLPLANEESNAMIKTTTLVIVVVTNFVLGMLTLPLVKLLKVQNKFPKVGFSKAIGMGRVIGPSEASSQSIKYKARVGKSPMSFIRGWRRFDKSVLMPFFIVSQESKNYEAAVTTMIDGWAKNEERISQQFLTSSCETDDNSSMIANRTRRNIVRPVRNFLKTVDDGSKTEDESREKVRFESIDETFEGDLYKTSDAEQGSTQNRNVNAKDEYSERDILRLVNKSYGSLDGKNNKIHVKISDSSQWGDGEGDDVFASENHTSKSPNNGQHT